MNEPLNAYRHSQYRGDFLLQPYTHRDIGCLYETLSPREAEYLL